MEAIQSRIFWGLIATAPPPFSQFSVFWGIYLRSLLEFYPNPLLRPFSAPQNGENKEHFPARLMECCRHSGCSPFQRPGRGRTSTGLMSYYLAVVGRLGESCSKLRRKEGTLLQYVKWSPEPTSAILYSCKSLKLQTSILSSIKAHINRTNSQGV